MSRFFVNPEDIGNNLVIMNDADDLHHMMKVLRLKKGDEVDISDGAEWEYRARIETLGRDEAQLAILDKQAFASEPSVEVTLFQGIPKQGKMETIVQKCVELGVHRIVPVFMDRTVVVDRGNFGKKIDRWNKVSAEAVKQCRRGIIPEVTAAIRMPDLVSALAGEPGHDSDIFDKFDLVLLPYENEKGTTIKDVLRDASPKRVAIIIGPEGGFSDEEALAVIAAGGVSVSLGRTILRTETAGMAALAMIMYELEL
ncbi:MAG: 16S rRNA (uracil(1498)-N(3))-methyltransferase [Firmicutes bacterium]|nr:16S rRNA (uracil(1498)-N(3))-methyltransferase [Bacillota bacterium]